MIREKVFKSACVVCATLIAAFCMLGGCSREEADASSPKSYMNDKAFIDDLKVLKRATDELRAAHAKLAAEMADMIEAAKKKLKTDDLAKVRAELEKSEKWNSLKDRCEDAATALKESIRKTENVVRKRISK